MSSSTSIELKLSLNDTTRLMTFPSSPAPVWANFAARVKERFSLEALPSAVIYVDSDGDEITMSSDAELAELWQSSADLFESLTLLVVLPLLTTPQPAARSPETIELLGSIAAALEQDPSLVHDLRNIVHSVCGPMRHGRHHRPHHHHHSFFSGSGGFGGRGRGKKEGRHGGWKMREESETSDTETEEQPSHDEGEKHNNKKKHRGSRKGFRHRRHHHRCDPHSPPFPFYGPLPCCAIRHAHHAPPPPPAHFQHHFHPPPPPHSSTFHPGPPFPPAACFFSDPNDEPNVFDRPPPPPPHLGRFGHPPSHGTHRGRRSHGLDARGGHGEFGRGRFHSASPGYAEMEEGFAQFGF
ncbi:hypothetical protein JCM21900_004392 [Sporobolomyces salmonicolor]